MLSIISFARSQEMRVIVFGRMKEQGIEEDLKENKALRLVNRSTPVESAEFLENTKVLNCQYTL